MDTIVVNNLDVSDGVCHVQYVVSSVYRLQLVMSATVNVYQLPQVGFTIRTLVHNYTAHRYNNNY